MMSILGYIVCDEDSRLSGVSFHSAVDLIPIYDTVIIRIGFLIGRRRCQHELLVLSSMETMTAESALFP